LSCIYFVGDYDKRYEYQGNKLYFVGNYQ